MRVRISNFGSLLCYNVRYEPFAVLFRAVLCDIEAISCLAVVDAQSNGSALLSRIRFLFACLANKRTCPTLLISYGNISDKRHNRAKRSRLVSLKVVMQVNAWSRETWLRSLASFGGSKMDRQLLMSALYSLYNDCFARSVCRNNGGDENLNKVARLLCALAVLSPNEALNIGRTMNIDEKIRPESRIGHSFS